MRAETKHKLDALERAQKLRKGLVIVVASGIVAMAAALYAQPRTLVGHEQAVVERSVVGRDHWGQPFHNLTVRLRSGETQPVETFLVPDPLPAGQHITLQKWSGFWGNVVYRVAQDSPTKSPPPLTPKSGRL